MFIKRLLGSFLILSLLIGVYGLHQTRLESTVPTGNQSPSAFEISEQLSRKLEKTLNKTHEKVSSLSCKDELRFTVKPVLASFGGLGLGYSNSVDNAGACDCAPAQGKEAILWEHCFKCIQTRFFSLYDHFSRELMQSFVDDTVVDTWLSFNNESLHVSSAPSDQPEFDHFIRIQNAEDEICLNLYFSKSKKDPKNSKAVFYFNTRSCTGLTGSLPIGALVMKVDFEYSNPLLESGEIIYTMKNKARQDGEDEEVIVMSFNKELQRPNPITTGWFYQVQHGRVAKFYLNGNERKMLLHSPKSTMANPTIIPLKTSRKNKSAVQDSPYSNADLSQLSYQKWKVSDFEKKNPNAVLNYFLR